MYLPSNFIQTTTMRRWQSKSKQEWHFFCIFWAAIIINGGTRKDCWSVFVYWRWDDNFLDTFYSFLRDQIVRRTALGDKGESGFGQPSGWVDSGHSWACWLHFLLIQIKYLEICKGSHELKSIQYNFAEIQSLKFKIKKFCENPFERWHQLS